MIRASIITLICLLVSALLVLSSLPSSHSVLGLPTLLVCALFAFFVQWLVFIPSYLMQTERFYDLTGSLTFISVAIIATVSSLPVDIYSIVLALMVIIWAIRLGSFLSMRINKDGKDDRFEQIKPNKYRFFVVWTVQGLWVLLTASAALIGISSQAGNFQLTLINQICMGVGILAWLVGLSMESIADWQKRRFKRKHPNKFINTGLWAYSQHPNYFGEILLWTGVALTALPALEGWQYFALISPIFVCLLLTKISGIPMLDAKAKKKWGDDNDYQSYIKHTPKLIPKLTTKNHN